MMASRLTVILFLCFAIGKAPAQNLNAQYNKTIQTNGFSENKGQLADQHGNLRPDIHFVYEHQGTKLLLRKSGFSIEQWLKSPSSVISESSGKTENNSTYHFHRVDVDFQNANPLCKISGLQALPTRFNYYLAHTPEDGITSVRSYQKVVYSNVYPNIDIEFLLHQDTCNNAIGVKYNFIINPGGKLADVQLDYQGMKNLDVFDSRIEYSTSLGTMQETLPNSYLIKNGQQVPINISYQSRNGLIGFDGMEAVLVDTLVVDPVIFLERKWATFYGDNDIDIIHDHDVDENGLVYVIGETNSLASIASAGSFQDSLWRIGSNAKKSVMMAKFSHHLDTMIWGTYYGGVKPDHGRSIIVDGKKIYITGDTESPKVFATSMAHDTSYNGGIDLFLAEFDTSGQRSWSTYFGGSKDDHNGKGDEDFEHYGKCISVGKNFLYMVGSSESSGLASNSAGGSYDGILTKFTKNGSLTWSRYLGGNAYDEIYAVTSNTLGDVFVVGSTESTTGISKGSSIHKKRLPSSAGVDAFLVKFNFNGSKAWGTYFGGSKDDFASSVTMMGNDLIMAGFTSSTDSISTNGVFRSTKSSTRDEDGFITRFSSNGSLKWGTYFGDNGDDDRVYSVAIDTWNNIALAGWSKSSSLHQSVAVYQKKDYGDEEAFFCKILPNGSNVIWFTYYGDGEADRSRSVLLDQDQYIVGAGYSFSTNTNERLATKGAHQYNNGGGRDGFVVRFCDIIITEQPQDQFVWLGNTAKFRVQHIGTTVGNWKYQWFKDGVALNGETKLNLRINDVDTADEGYYHLKISNDCGELLTDSAKLTIYKFTPPSVICKGSSTQIKLDPVSGATYSWSPAKGLSSTSGYTVIASPYTTTTYQVIISGNNIADTLSIEVKVKPIPNANAGADVSTCSGKKVQLGSTGCTGCTYSWTPSTDLTSTTISNPTLKRTNNGNSKQTYTYKVTTSLNGCVSSDEVKVNIYPLPKVDAGKNKTFCLNDNSTNLSGSPSKGTWRGNGITDSTKGTFNPLIAGTGTHKISYHYTDNNGCYNSDNISIIVNDTPTVYAGKDAFFCNTSTSVSLKGKPSGGTWTGNSNLTSSGVFNPNKAGNGTYNLYYTVKNSSTCSNTDTVEIRVGNITKANGGKDLEVCLSDAAFALTGASPTGGTWSGKGVSSGKFDPTTAGVGKFTITYSIGSGTCLSTDDIYITVNALPNISPGNNLTKCLNEASFNLKNFSPTGGTWKGTGITNGKNGTFSPKTAGKGSHYAVYEFTNTKGCKAKDSLTITVNDTPAVNAYPEKACDIAGIIQLSATPTGGDWSGSKYVKANGKFDAKTAGPGTYIVAYTVKKNGCTSTDTATVSIISATTIDAGDNDTLCLNASPITLKGIQPATGGTWSGKGVASGKFLPATAGFGLHTITFSVGSGSCLNTDKKQILVQSLPNISLGSSLTKCLNASDFNISGFSPTGGTWTGTGITNSTNATYSPAKVGTGVHYAYYSATNSNGCSNSDTLEIDIIDTPTVNAKSVKACDIAGIIQLSGTPAGGDWSGSKYVKANGKFDAKTAGPGTYLVAYTVQKNGCSSTDTAKVEIISPQSIDAGLNDTFCVNDSAVSLKSVKPTSGGTWSGNGVSSSQFSPTNAGTGIHQIIFSIGSGTCLNRDTITYKVNALPTVKAGSDIKTCINKDSLIISSQYPNGGTWTGKGISTNNNALFLSKTAGIGTHNLVYTFKDLNGCVNSDSLEFTVNDLPQITVRDTQVCSIGGKVSLPSKPSYGTWSGHKEVTLSGQFDVTKAGVGKYSLYFSATNSTTGCTNKDTIIVDVITPKKANAGLNDSLCINHKKIDLHGRPTGGKWSGSGMSDSTFDAAKAGAGKHHILYTYGSGTCMNTDSTLMVVHSLPTVDAGNSLKSCISDDSFQITQFTPKGGAWRKAVYNDSISGNINPKKTGFGTHKLIYYYTDANGCSNFDSTKITVNALPVITVDSVQIFCNQPVQVNLIGKPASGKWTGKNISNDSIYTPNGVDTHFVFYTYKNPLTNCVNTDSSLIQVTNPELVSTMIDTSVCHFSDSFKVRAKPSGGNWSGNNLKNGSYYDPLDTGLHQLLYTKGSGTCQTYDTLTINVIPLPIVDAGLPIFSCEKDDTLLIDTTAYSPLGGIWSGQSIINKNAGILWPQADTPGTKTIHYSYTNPINGCTNADSTTYTINPLPKVSVTDTTICNQPQASQFFGSPSGGSWSQNGITSTGSFTPKDTGLYPVVYTFTDANNCTNRDTMQINVINPIYAKAVPDFEICIYDQKLLTGSPKNGWWKGPDINSLGLFTPDSAGTINLYYSIGVGTCLTRDTTKVVVHPLPKMEILGPKKLCTNDPIYKFSNVSKPKGGWFIGSGISDSLLGSFNPRLAGAGRHTIYYHYINPTTKCYNLDSHSFDVKGLPALNFNLDSVLCVSTIVSFSNGSSAGNTYEWNFGDGSGWKQGFSQSHTYSDTGEYIVQVIGTTPDGCSDTFDQLFYVVDPPKARFDISPRKGCGPLNVKFVDYTKGRFLSYQWAFETGDTISTSELDSFIFPFYPYDSITYTLELKVTNVCRSDFWYDSVRVYPPPTANVHIEPKIGCTPLVVTMRDKSYGMPGQRQYNFGDGVLSSRTDTIFDYTYFTDSSKTIYQFSYNSQNICGTDTQFTDIVVKPNFLRSFFELDTNQGCTPFTLHAVDHHKGNATVSWWISDGKTYGHEDKIQHELSTPGTYTVRQMLDNGCARDTFRSTVIVHQSPEPDFSIDSTETCENIDVFFKNLTQNVSGTSWQFGDGSTSLLPRPSHRYTKADTFSVRLLVVGDNEFQCPATITKPVVILPLPNIVVNPKDTFGCRELKMSFKSQSSNARFYQWLMNDGSKAEYAGDSIQHTFLDSGVFVSQLIAESPKGCVDTGEFVTRVYARPEAHFKTDSAIYCDAPHAIKFYNTSRYGNAFTWDFDDGNSSVSRSPQHVFKGIDTFAVQLIAENRYRCTDTFTAPIEIIRTPIIDISPDPKEGCEPVLARFLNNTRFADSFYWYHSDGRIKTDTSPVFRLMYTGQPYSIKLVASNKRTCFDSVELMEPVDVKASPFADFRFDQINDNPQIRRMQLWDESKNSVRLRYTVMGRTLGDTLGTLYEPDPLIDFAYNDTFDVEMTAWNEVGCPDDTLRSLLPQKLYNLSIPNAFAPHLAPQDGAYFEPKGTGIESFSIWIYNQWGELVFCSSSEHDPIVDEHGHLHLSWDGTVKLGKGCVAGKSDNKKSNVKSNVLKQDLYIYKIKATFRDGRTLNDGQNGFYSGSVLLIK